MDLRQWLGKAEEIGQLVIIEGADWNLEIGAVTLQNVRNEECPALLFDQVKDYPEGFRVLTCAHSTPARTALTLNLPVSSSKLELLGIIKTRLKDWERQAAAAKPEFVKTGTVAEKVMEGAGVDLYRFPSPMWHEEDGGRYIGTGCAVITANPLTGQINLGAYRNMVIDNNTVSIQASPGKHGRLDYENWHAQGKACPVAVSVGHHPLVFAMAALSWPRGMEYGYISAISGEPVSVIKEEITGLPIPADADIVLAGFCPPDKFRPEGPFGEWTGYYVSTEKPNMPIIEVERIYYRHNPIILGSPPGHPPASGHIGPLITSAQLHEELERMGVPDIRGVWTSDAAGAQIIAVSLRQRYAGHAKQAAVLVNQSCVGPALKRYVIVVDEDIDPTDIQDVMWAVGSRSDPSKGIDILRRCRSTPQDPTIRHPAEAFFNSRAIIDACRPFEWKDQFPRAITVSEALKQRVREKWGNLVRL